MSHSDTDTDWESWAKDNPYWAVLTEERFRTPNLDAETRAEFFSSGESYVEWVFDTIRGKLSQQFAPQRALDFGCGVGRLLLPLAARCNSAVGVDVSESMLRETETACKERKIENVTLVKSDDRLTGIRGRFDFINSSIVFQHIPCHRGVQLFHRLVDLLSDDGFGALHFTYAKGRGEFSQADLRLFADWPGEDGFWYHLSGLKRALKRRFARAKLRPGMPLAGFLRRKTGALPAAVVPNPMQMNAYALNPIVAYLQNAGVRQLHVAFTDHGGTLGAAIFFQKNRYPSYLLPAHFEKII